MDVNQIFKDLATMVHEQGEMVDSIEANVEMAQVHVSQAATQLTQARNYQVRFYNWHETHKNTIEACFLGV